MYTLFAIDIHPLRTTYTPPPEIDIATASTGLVCAYIDLVGGRADIRGDQMCDEENSYFC